MLTNTSILNRQIFKKIEEVKIWKFLHLEKSAITFAQGCTYLFIMYTTPLGNNKLELNAIFTRMILSSVYPSIQVYQYQTNEQYIALRPVSKIQIYGWATTFSNQTMTKQNISQHQSEPTHWHPSLHPAESHQDIWGFYLIWHVASMTMYLKFAKAKHKLVNQKNPRIPWNPYCRENDKLFYNIAMGLLQQSPLWHSVYNISQLQLWCCHWATNSIISLKSWKSYTGNPLNKKSNTKCCWSLIKLSMVKPMQIPHSCCLCILQTGTYNQRPKSPQSTKM